MKIKDCLDIIAECVDVGLQIKFDYLTTADKNQVQDTCDNMLYAIAKAIDWSDEE